MDLNLVVIEHWQLICSRKCPDHGWCTNHDESKYLNYYEKVSLSINATCPELYIETNNLNLMSRNMLGLYNSQANLYKKLSFPRIGSFEVLFRGKLIFSKLKTGRWPNPLKIAEEIRNIIDGIVVFQNQIKAESPARPGTSGLRKSQSAYGMKRNKALI